METAKCRRPNLFRLAASALVIGASAVSAHAQATDTVVPYLPVEATPELFTLPSVGFMPRGGNVLYQRIVETGNRFGASLGGNPVGSGTQIDIAIDDVPITAANLQVAGAVVSRIDVCQIRIGIRALAGAPASDINVYWTTLDSTATGSNLPFVSPLNLILDGASPTSTTPPLGGPGGVPVTRSIPATAATNTNVLTIGDGINPIPGMAAVPLNMAFLTSGTPATFGTFAIGVQIGSTNTNLGWRITSGAAPNGNFFYVYDTDLPNPETGPFAFQGGVPSSFYIEVLGNPVAPTTPQACCLPNASGAAVCFVADGTANCTLSGGTALPGQTVCSGSPCASIVCCNQTTGICTVLAGVLTCPGSQVLAGAGACNPNPCTQPAAPANDECFAATPGSAFELTIPATATLINQTTVGGTPSASGVPACMLADDDVWYLLTLTPAQAAFGTQYQITVDANPDSGDFTAEPLGISVYDGGIGCPATATGELACVDIADPNSAIFASNGSLSYFIRVGFFGPGTAQFSIAVAPVTTGACCNPTNGLCVLSNNVGVCTTAGYTNYMGNGSVCTPNPCSRGACCASDGACALTGPSGCTGTYRGDGTTCSPTNSCLGSCCNSVTFACTLVNDAQSSTLCAAPNTYNGAGTTCLPSPCAPPLNDQCGDATILTVGTPLPGQRITAATGVELASCSLSNVDVWYTFTPTVSGNYRVRTTPASPTDSATSIAIFDDGFCDPALDSDLACSGQPLDGEANEVLITVTANTLRKIRVGAFAGDEGFFSIVVEAATGAGGCCLIDGTCVVVAAAADCVAPNTFSGADVLCSPTLCPARSCCLATSSVCFNTTQEFCSFMSGTWGATPASTSEAGGCFGTPAVNDNCPAATAITSPTFTTTFGNDLASNEGAPAGTCNSADAQAQGADNSVWFSFTSTVPGQLTGTFDSFGTYDMILAAFTGTCGALVPAGCLDEPEPIDFVLNAPANTTFFFMVADFGVTDGGGWNRLDTEFIPATVCCRGTACTIEVPADCTAGTTPGTVGSGTTCTPSPCVPTTENCCRGTTCNSITAGTCTGVVAGSNSLVVTSCGAGNALSTCCFADYNHDGIQSIDDLFLYFNAYFTASPWANVGGDGVATPTIDDLFLYINAYFSTCAP